MINIKCVKQVEVALCQAHQHVDSIPEGRSTLSLLHGFAWHRICFVEASIASRWIGQKTTKLAFDMYSLGSNLLVIRELETRLTLKACKRTLEYSGCVCYGR